MNNDLRAIARIQFCIAALRTARAAPLSPEAASVDVPAMLNFASAITGRIYHPADLGTPIDHLNEYLETHHS